MKTIWTSVALAMTIAANTTAAYAQKVSPAVTSALADPARADQQGDDARRKAADVLEALSTVSPEGDAVTIFKQHAEEIAELGVVALARDPDQEIVVISENDLD